LQFGFESGVQRVLDAMKKGNNLEQIEVMLDNLKDHGIIVAATWFIGFPNESEEDARETWRFIRRHVGKIHYSLYTGTFGLGSDVPVFQHPEQYGITVGFDSGGNPTYTRNDGLDWDHQTLHHGFQVRSDVPLVISGAALLYAANRPNLISRLRGVGAVGPVSWEAPPIEERFGWVPAENACHAVGGAGDSRRYVIFVAQSGEVFEADQADVDILTRIGTSGCVFGTIVSAPDAPSDVLVRLARLIDCGVVEAADGVPVAAHPVS
jgi:hypothetical protein